MIFRVKLEVPAVITWFIEVCEVGGAGIGVSTNFPIQLLSCVKLMFVSGKLNLVKTEENICICLVLPFVLIKITSAFYFRKLYIPTL